MTCCTLLLVFLVSIAFPPLGLLIFLGASMLLIYHLWMAAFPPPPRLTPSQVAQLRVTRNKVLPVALLAIGAFLLAAHLRGW